MKPGFASATYLGETDIQPIMIVQVRDIPDEGLRLHGESEKDIFEIKEDGVAFSGPLKFDVRASIVTESILVMGEVSAQFNLRCSRCLDTFPQTILQDDFAFSEPLEGRSSIDLTDAVREDILLALPIHPLCENGTPPRECQAAGLFEENDSAPLTQDDSESGDDAWSGLEGFETKDD
ncbi:MAG: uncharacterized metal-binding protein YceD (DUF177 family) [Verrucomicrobiales bacterium]|jgi:uncharacterized metal-binding protein YceD (DUF177 family)